MHYGFVTRPSCNVWVWLCQTTIYLQTPELKVPRYNFHGGLGKHVNYNRWEAINDGLSCRSSRCVTIDFVREHAFEVRSEISVTIGQEHQFLWW